jgi:hypothetical protein
LLANTALFAQKITGDIEGNVTDSSGAVVGAADISAQNVGTGLVRTAKSSGSGNYRINDLPIGSYKISAEAPGFKTVVRTAEIQAGALTHADFSLMVGQRNETVEVEGAAPLVELSPNENNYVDQEKIAALPINGRDFNSLVATTPGVQRAPGGGFLAISVNGARTTSNNYFIDGLYNNDRYYGDSAIGETGILGVPAVSFPPEAIEELSVQETPGAEFGVKGGAPILLNMKSGTNAFHGSGTWVNHSGIGDAVNYFSNHTSDCNSSPGACQKTNIHNNQMNGTFGGPIIKDKAFFFVYYEGQRLKSLAVSNRAVPSTADIAAAKADIAANGATIDPVGLALVNYFPSSPDGRFTASTPANASQNSFGVKLDFKITPKNSLTVRYIFGDSYQSAPPFAGLPAAGGRPDLFNSVAPSRAQLAGISWTSQFSNNKVLESRLGYTRFSQTLGVNNKINPQSLGIDTGPLSPNDFGVPYVYMYHLGYGGYIGGVQGYPLVTTPDATWDWAEHFSWVKGNHTIKIGGNFQRAYTNSTRNDARSGLTAGYFSSYVGYYFPGSVANTAQDDVEELLLGKADLANRSFGNTHRHITQNSVGLYVQDEWKIKPRFTVTYGLRYDINGTMRDTNDLEANFIPGRGLVQVGKGISGIHNVDYRDFGPRLGFAWDIFGKGKTALRGGYALTYDVANFGALASPYGFAHSHTGVFTQANLGFFNVSNYGDIANGVGSDLPPAQTNYILGQGCYDPVAQVGDYICFDSKRLGNSLFGPDPTGTGPINAFSVVQNFKTPRYHNINLSLQHELFRNSVLTVAYSGQRGRDLVIYQDLNASPIGSIDPNTGKVCASQGACDPFRPYSTIDPTLNLRHLIQATNRATSQYDSLQASFNQRDWHGFDVNYNLTWSKCYDQSSVNRGGAGDYPQINNSNPVGSTALGVANFNDSRGLCDHDVRLNFNVGGVYFAPRIPFLGKRMGNGWQLSTIFTAISGRPFTPLVNGSSDPSGQGMDGLSVRGAWDGTPIRYNTRNPDQYINEIYTGYDQTDPCGLKGAPDPKNPGHFFGGLPLSPFYTSCAGSVGNARRNSVIGPGLAQWDVSLIKETKITERLNVQVRWEVFNILNRGNFYYLPNNTLSSCGNLVVGGLCPIANAGNLGTITETSDTAAGNPVIAQGGPRNMNFSLKFTF